MTQKTSPFIQAKYGWNLGESGWNGGMDENLLKFSYMADRNIDGIVATLPAAVDGKAYFNTSDNLVYYAVEGVFYFSVVAKWSRLYDRASGSVYIFNGSSLIPDATQSQISNIKSYTDSLQSVTSGAVLVKNSTVSVLDIQSLLSSVKDVSLTYNVKRWNSNSIREAGEFYWDPNKNKTAHDGFLVISDTVPYNGSDSATLDFLNGVGETSPAEKGCFVRSFNGPVLIEWAGANPVRDSGPIFQYVINKLLLTPYSILATEEYLSSVNIEVPTYRTPAAPVYKDFCRTSLNVNKLTFTGTSGAALFIGTPVARLTVKRLIGPGTSAGITDGVRISGFGDPNHRIGWVTGFTNDVHLDNCFGQTIHCGWWSGDCVRGLYLTSSNACKVLSGRIGGGFSSSDVDPESPEVGVAIASGCSNNEIHSNIEYCRRSSTSVGYQDFGVANFFYGYIESCSAFNIIASGRDSHHKVLAGGTNIQQEQSGIYPNDTNSVELLAQFDNFNEIPDGSNVGLTFLANQALGFGNSGRVYSQRGLDSFTLSPESYQNVVLQSNDLTSAAWNSTSSGGALWSNVVSTISTVALPEMGLYSSTKMVFPSNSATDALYNKSQTVTVANGPTSYGLFAYCESGEVEVFVRIVGSGRQARQQYKLVESSGFIRIQSRFTNNQATDPGGTYQLQFRSLKGGTVYLMAAHCINYPNVEVPVTNSNTITKAISGAEVKGNTFYSGVRFNGQVRHCPSPVLSGSTGITIDSNRKYSWYVVGALNANITVSVGRDGDELLFTRNGATSTGCSLLGSFSGASSINLTAAYSKVRVRYSSDSGEWLVI